MARRPPTVAELSQQSGFELEDVVIELVRLGLTYAADPRSTLRAEDVRRARTALGLSSPSDERKKSYWLDVLGLDEEELEQLLSRLAIQPSPRARMLPKGAHAKLVAHMEATVPRRTKPIAPQSQAEPVDSGPMAPPVQWRVVGQKRVTYWLSAEEVLLVHEALEADAELAADPIFPPGLKSMNLLASACMRPQTGIPGDAKYPTVEMAGAALVHSIVGNHAFFNGNKRTAVVSLMVFLDRNNHWLRDTVNQQELYLWILEVARHRLLDHGVVYQDRADREVLEMAEWIRRNSRPIERSERPISWRDLRVILERDFGCSIELRPSGKVTIRRTVRGKSRNPLRGFRRDSEHSYTFTPGGDGREVGLGTVKKLRTQLCLTEEFNIDSAIFYGNAAGPDRFITKYQRLLRDLARV